VAAAAPGSRFQFVRLGYFIADAVDASPGKPVFNRTITLKDAWSKPAPVEKPEERRGEKKAPSAPVAPRKGREEARAELRAKNPVLAERHARYLGLVGADEADVLSGELALADYFDAALGTGAAPRTAAKWLVNELLGLAKERDLATLALGGVEFGRFVTLVDAGRVTQTAGKTLLAKLVEEGGSAEARLLELGLEKVEDAGAVGAALDRVFEKSAGEVARYRAGEKKLLGVLLGATMRETGGAADAGMVRKALLERLG